jgi:acetyl esterase/lipase
MSTFVIHPLPAGEVDAEAPSARTRDADGPSPCRRCLRNAEVGDRLVHAPYDPFTRRSPYAGEGPVFVHAGGCEPFRPEPGAVSEQVAGRVLSVRAYDADAMMTEAVVLEGERFRESAAELLGDEQVAFLHVHFAGPGCFAFRVDRA